MTEAKTKAPETQPQGTQPVTGTPGTATSIAVQHPLMEQLTGFYNQLMKEKDKVAMLEMDKAEVNKAHAFLVGQNPNTPAGPRCMRLLETLDNLLKNEANMISNIENMMNGCKAQIEFENANAIIDHLAKRYES